MTIIYGIIIGIFVSLIGGGGASLYLGVLTGIVGISTQQAATTSLFVALPALFFNFLTQNHYHNIRFKYGIIMIISAIPTIIIGTIFSKSIPTNIYNLVVGTILIVMGILVIIKSFKKKKKSSNHRNHFYAVLFGLLSGAMVGIGGLSGGAPVVAGLSILGLNALEATGTSAFVLCIMSLIGLISHIMVSSVAWKAGFTLMIGAVFGSIIAPIIINKIDFNRVNNILSPLIGLVIVFFGIKLVL